MISKRGSWISIFVLLFLAVSSSCAEDSSDKTVTNLTTVKSTSNLPDSDTPAQTQYKDFDKFYNAFSSAVVQSDWINLAELTRFPLILKGELDDVEEVAFDKNDFVGAIGKLLNEEIYLNIDDELVETTFRKIISDTEIKPNTDADEIQLFGLLFSKKSDGWKLSEITTHVHIVEMFTEE